jgi:tubulin polyglutamylase TTLL1
MQSKQEQRAIDRFLAVKPTVSPIQMKTSPNATYSFEDSFIAYHLLQQLDIFESMGPHDYSQGHPSEGLLWGLKMDEGYCAKHRHYFASNPQYIFEEMNFLADEPKYHMLRNRTIPSIGRDMHPKIGYGMDEDLQDSFTIDQKPDINIFYTNPFMHERRAVGVHYSCLTQISNHIPGNEKMGRKDLVGEALVTYTKKYASRPTCFNNDKFFPKTWVLTHEDQCKEFFADFNSPNYKILKKQRNIVYFRKIGAEVHKGEGVFPVDNNEEKYVRELYKNGALCGQIEDNNVMQYFIHNPLLLEGRKFDFRIYMLIASTNPLIAYYHDGYLRMSLHEYDSSSQEKGVFLTNTAVSRPLFAIAEKNGTYQGLTLEEIKQKSYWLYPQLHKYLQEQGKVTDPDWVENYLRKEVKRAMIHLIRMGQDTLLKKSSLHELYGVDFMMDENLDLWFIEANARPLIEGWTPERNDYFNSMLVDSFEIVFGLLRSRTKRIANYINHLTQMNGEWEYKNGNMRVNSLEERRAEFRELTKNRFEPEFEPRAGNGFQKIIDENLSGVDRYMGLIEEECL